MPQVITKVKDPEGQIIKVKHWDGAPEQDIIDFARKSWETKRFAELEQEDLDAGTGKAGTPPVHIGELSGPSEPFNLEEHIDAVKDVPENLKKAGEHLWENKWAYTLGTVGAFMGWVPSMALGALGTGIDTYIKEGEEETAEEDSKIFRDVGLTLGIDAAVLATLKIPPAITRSIVKAIKGGVDPKIIFEAIIKDQTNDLGTKASTIEVQKFLQHQDATLTLGQAGKRGPLTSFLESVSFSGLFSNRVHYNNLQKIHDIAQQATQRLFNSNLKNISAVQLGENILANQRTARRAAIVLHGKSLDQLKTMLSKDSVDLTPINKALSKWQNDPKNFNKLVGQSRLTPQAESILKKYTDIYKDLQNGSPMTYIELMKDINADISLLNAVGTDTFAPAAARQLTDLANVLRETTVKQIRKTNPKAAVLFNKAQKSYGDTMNNLFPAINKNFVSNVDETGVYPLGDMVTMMSSTENVKKLYKTIDTAYAVTTKAQRQGLKVRSPHGMKQIIRQRYLEKNLQLSKNLETLDFAEFKRMAIRLSDPDEAALAKEVLGKDSYNGLKLVSNALAKASEEPGSNFGLLALRARELAFAVGGAAMIGTGSYSGAGSLIAGGIGVLFTPVVMAKIVTNKALVSRFLGLKSPKLSKKALLERATILANDVHKELNEDQKNELAETMNPLSYF